MADYIRRSKVEFELCGGNLPEKYKAFVRRVLNDKNLVPAADVAEVVHGEWEETDCDTIICSRCGFEYDLICMAIEDYTYCPNCGAKMDGG